MESTTLTPSDTHGTPTLRQQIDNLPAYVLNAWRSRYANAGMDLEAHAIIDREAATIRAKREMPDALAVWMRLADVAGQMRDTPPARPPSWPQLRLLHWQSAYACRGSRRPAAPIQQFQPNWVSKASIQRASRVSRPVSAAGRCIKADKLLAGQVLRNTGWPRNGRSLVTCTGTNTGIGASAPARTYRRQFHSRPRLTSCRWATAANDAPGCSTSAMMRSFSSSRQRRRRSTPVMISIQTPAPDLNSAPKQASPGLRTDGNGGSSLVFAG